MCKLLEKGVEFLRTAATVMEAQFAGSTAEEVAEPFQDSVIRPEIQQYEQQGQCLLMLAWQVHTYTIPM